MAPRSCAARITRWASRRAPLRGETSAAATIAVRSSMASTSRSAEISNPSGELTSSTSNARRACALQR